jgi:hypothetical protein
MLHRSIPNPGNVSIERNYMKDLNEFEELCKMDYCEWFYFT